MALFSTTNLKAFDEVEGVKKRIKLGDKIYTNDEQAQTIRNILNKYQIFTAHRAVEVAGKYVHEFTIRLKPVELAVPERPIGYLLQPHYEAELAS